MQQFEIYLVALGLKCQAGSVETLVLYTQSARRLWTFTVFCCWHGGK